MRVQVFLYALLLAALTDRANAQDAGTPALGPVVSELDAGAQAFPPAARPRVAADQTVLVTGSRLYQREDARTQQVISLDAAQIRRTGATTLNEALLRLPSVSLQGINKNLNNGGRGIAAVDLRSLGPQRTLVLIDGRRVVPISAGRAEVVDLSFIPLELVERVDILLDGASAVYGSDAVGGVINVVLKRNFDGLRSGAFSGVSSHGDAEEAGGSLTLGKNHARGNITLSLQGLFRAPVVQRDRSWARGPVTSRSYVDPNNPAAGVTTFYGSGAAPATYEPDNSATVFRPDPSTGKGFTNFPYADSQRYDYGAPQYLVMAERRVGGTLLATHDLSEHTHLFLEASYVYRHSEARSGPSSLGYGTTTYPGGFVVPSSNNPFLPSDYVPSTEQLPLARTNTEAGNVSSDYDVHTSRAVLGFGGEIPSLTIDWEVYANAGLVRAQTTTRNLVDLSRALTSADPTACAAAPGCVLGNYLGTSTLQADTLRYIRYTGLEYAGNSHVSSGASLRARPLRLWGEDVGVVAGLLARREQAFYQPSETAARGDATSDIVSATRGAYRALDVFAELGVPLLAHLPGAELVRLELAGRYAANQRFGSQLTYRVGLSYAPIAGLTLRGSVATAFRAPGVTELFGGRAASYQGVRDPCDNPQTAEAQQNCAGVSSARFAGAPALVNAGGNRRLSAERSRTLNLGLSYASHFRDARAGKTVGSLNYYRTVIDDEITTPDLGAALATCYASPGLSAASCAVNGRDANGNLTLDGRPRNASRGSTSGVELTGSHALPFAALGWKVPASFDVQLQLHRLLYWDTLEYGTKSRYAGTIAASYGSLAKWRWALTEGFSGERWSVASVQRYIGNASVLGAMDSPDRGVSAVLYWDVVASYRVHTVDLSAGVNNLLDKAPPFLLDYSTNSSPFSYDYVGRYFFVRASHTL